MDWPCELKLLLFDGLQENCEDSKVGLLLLCQTGVKKKKGVRDLHAWHYAAALLALAASHSLLSVWGDHWELLLGYFSDGWTYGYF